MIFDQNIAAETAKQLLQINAIKLSPENPFLWASGWQSPIYCDNRIVLSYPRVRNFIREHIAAGVEQIYGKPDLIVGVATGAIGVGVLVAESLGLPFAYVRPKPKEHGRKNQIEGAYEKGQSVVVIEDLISSGQSSLNAVEALRDEGLVVKGMLAIFTYGFNAASQNFSDSGVTLHTLSDYDHLILEANKIGYLKEDQLETLKAWRKEPSKWKVQ